MKERCEFFEKCKLFQNPMLLNSGLAAPVRVDFCQGCKQNCARFRVAVKVGLDVIPTTLLPYMNDRANLIIAEYSFKDKPDSHKTFLVTA